MAHPERDCVVMERRLIGSCVFGVVVTKVQGHAWLRRGARRLRSMMSCVGRINKSAPTSDVSEITTVRCRRCFVVYHHHFATAEKKRCRRHRTSTVDHFYNALTSPSNGKQKLTSFTSGNIRMWWICCKLTSTVYIYRSDAVNSVEYILYCAPCLSATKW